MFSILGWTTLEGTQHQMPIIPLLTSFYIFIWMIFSKQYLGSPRSREWRWNFTGKLQQGREIRGGKKWPDSFSYFWNYVGDEYFYLWTTAKRETKIEFSITKRTRRPRAFPSEGDSAVCPQATAAWQGGLASHPLFLTFNSENIFPLLLHLVVNNGLLLFKASVPQSYGQKRKYSFKIALR